MPKSAIDVIGTAFDHSKKQLMEPFRFGQWARLAVLALATGEMSSGGGCNFRGFGNLPSKFPTHSDSFVGSGDALSRLGLDPAVLASMIVVAVIGFLVVGLVWIYVASITRFMLFESVLRKRCELRAGWERWQGQGLRFFGWQLALAVVGLIVAAMLFLPLLLPVLAAMRNHHEPGPGLLIAFLPMILVFVAFALAMHLIGVLAKDFVVPLMAVDNVGVIEGWRRLLAMMKADALSYAGYIGMKIILSIGAAVVFTILSAIVAIFALIPVAIVGVIVVVAAKGAGLMWNVFTITAAVVAGVIAIGVLMYLVALVCVPVAVFFPAYAMYFFGERYPALQALLFPPPPAPSLPPQPPPLGATPAPIG